MFRLESHRDYPQLGLDTICLNGPDELAEQVLVALCTSRAKPRRIGLSTTGIKGAAFESIVSDVLRLVDEERLTRGDLEARLTAEDLGILDTKVHSAQWYPLDSCSRMTEILFRTEGLGQIEYLVERGRRAARRLEASGIYSQIAARATTWGSRVGHMMVTLGPAMFRGTIWKHRTEMDGKEIRSFEVTLLTSEDFPELLRHSTQGFIDHLAELATDGRFRIASRRISPREIRFTGRPVRV